MVTGSDFIREAYYFFLSVFRSSYSFLDPFWLIVVALSYAGARLSYMWRVLPFVCLSVCLSVNHTLMLSGDNAHRITWFSSSRSPGNLVFEANVYSTDRRITSLCEGYKEE